AGFTRATVSFGGDSGRHKIDRNEETIEEAIRRLPFKLQCAFYHAFKRRTTMRDRELKLAFEVGQRQIIKKDVTGLKTSLLRHNQKVAFQQIARRKQVTSSHQSSDGDFFPEETIAHSDDLELCSPLAVDLIHIANEY